MANTNTDYSFDNIGTTTSTTKTYTEAEAVEWLRHNFWKDDNVIITTTSTTETTTGPFHTGTEYVKTQTCNYGFATNVVPGEVVEPLKDYEWSIKVMHQHPYKRSHTRHSKGTTAQTEEFRRTYWQVPLYFNNAPQLEGWSYGNQGSQTAATSTMIASGSGAIQAHDPFIISYSGNITRGKRHNSGWGHGALTHGSFTGGNQSSRAGIPASYKSGLYDFSSVRDWTGQYGTWWDTYYYDIDWITSGAKYTPRIGTNGHFGWTIHPAGTIGDITAWTLNSPVTEDFIQGLAAQGWSHCKKSPGGDYDIWRLTWEFVLVLRKPNSTACSPVRYIIHSAPRFYDLDTNNDECIKKCRSRYWYILDTSGDTQAVSGITPPMGVSRDSDDTVEITVRLDTGCNVFSNWHNVWDYDNVQHLSDYCKGFLIYEADNGSGITTTKIAKIDINNVYSTQDGNVVGNAAVVTYNSNWKPIKIILTFAAPGWRSQIL